jgi:hypothetical protein
MTKHALSGTVIEARCPDCSASLKVPVVVSGLERNDDGERVLTLTVQDELFEPYARQHLALSDHPELSALVGDDWSTAETGAPLPDEGDGSENG